MRFSEIIGQNEIKKQLVAMVQEERISHALLFLGSSGFGGFPLALAFVQFIACTNRQENDSCGECPACRKISKLQHPDLHFAYPVISSPKYDKPESDHFLDFWRDFVKNKPYGNYNQWLDALKSENSQGTIRVQEAGAILRKLSLKSYESEYKFMVIWMAEKMNVETANKLLKILEEPPSKTLFILLAESSELLLNTILSRTQIIKIPRFSDKILVEQLTSQLGLNADSALQIARMSEGDYNEAIDLAQSSEENDNLLSYFQQMMRLSYSANFIELNKWVDEVSKFGREKIKNYFMYSLRLLRENLMLNCQQHQLARMSTAEKDFSMKFSAFIHPGNAPMLLEEMNKAYYHISRNANSKIVLLDTCIKLGQILRIPKEE